MRYFQQKTGTSFQLVPYRGGAPVLQDLVAGQIDMFCAEASQTLPILRSGTIKAFAVMSKARWPAAPDVPTFDESGCPACTFRSGTRFGRPRVRPPTQLRGSMRQSSKRWRIHTVRQRLTELGHVIASREEQTPEGLAAFHKAEIEKWWPIIKTANIKPE